MFTGTSIRLDADSNTAAARLANLARGGLLGRASGRAYDQWQAGLARVGPRGTVLGMSRLARVQVREMMTRRDSALWVMRWEVVGRGGGLVAALDADIKLTPDGDHATLLTVSAVCRPSLARLAAGLDDAIVRRVARTAIRAFTSYIATAIPDPVNSFRSRT
jgi:hypothetical protein